MSKQKYNKYVLLIILMVLSSVMYAEDLLAIQQRHKAAQVHLVDWPNLHKAIDSRDFNAAKEILANQPEEIHQVPQLPAGLMVGDFGNYAEYDIMAALSKLPINVKGPSALFTAVLSDEIDLVRMLLENGAKVNSSHLEIAHIDDYGFNIHISTPLHAALEIGNREMIELLLLYKADADFVFKTSRVQRIRSREFVEERVNIYSLVKFTDDRELIKLKILYSMNNEMIFDEIPEEVVDCYQTYERKSKHLALQQAILDDDFQTFQLLLQYGANANSKLHSSPIELAFKKTDMQYAQQLLPYVPDALIYAVKTNEIQLVNFVLENEIPEISVVNEAINKALKNQQLEILETLILYKKAMSY